MIRFILALMIISSVAVAGEYDDFVTFTKTNMGADSDSLYYVYAGGDSTMSLSFDGADSVFTSISENFAFFGFAGNLPADAWVEYDDNIAFASSDTFGLDDRMYYRHNIWLTGLTEETEYYYRLHMKDARDSTAVSDVDSFTTLATGRAGITYLYSGTTVPYTLVRDSTYVLKADLTSDTVVFAFDNVGGNITIDLNGHTITYDNGTPVVAAGSTWDQYRDPTASHGVYFGNNGSGTIKNGKIIQGATGSYGPSVNTYAGFNPIFANTNATNVTDIYAIYAEYRGSDLCGINHWGSGSIHHCVIKDTGTVISDREEGLRAISTYVNVAKTTLVDVYSNLIKRARHVGISLNKSTAGNEVYIDSWATNSYGIWPVENTSIRRNKLFGTGYHNIAIGWPIDVDIDSLVVSNNFVHLVGDTPSTRSTEYGDMSSMNGMRITAYGNNTYTHQNIEYKDNVIIVQALGDEPTGAGRRFTRGFVVGNDMYYYGTTYRDNIVKAELLINSASTSWPAVCVAGHGLDRGGERPTYHINNTYISNSVNIDFADLYGSGNNNQFWGCNIIKEGSRSDFKTIEIGYSSDSTYNHVFIDCVFSGGAAISDYEVATGVASAILGYDYGHSLWITATTDGSTAYAEGDSVRVYDATGHTFTGEVGADGLTRIELLEGGWYSDDLTVGMDAVDHGAVVDGDYILVAMSAASDTITVTPTIWSYEDNEDSPLTINFATGAAGPPTITAPTNLTATKVE